MALGLGAALGISAGAGLINSWLGADTAKKNTQRTIAAQKELANYQHQKDVEMWNMANKYNAPTAQMGRLKDAGLNPNMVYGSGSAAGNTSAQTPKYQMYNPQYKNVAMQLPNVMGVLNMYQDLQLKKEQTNNVAADSQIKQQQAVNEGMRELGIWADSALKYKSNRYKNLYGQELAKTQLDMQRQNVKKMQLENNLRVKGLNPNDPSWMRMLSRGLDNYIKMSGKTSWQKYWKP